MLRTQKIDSKPIRESNLVQTDVRKREVGKSIGVVHVRTEIKDDIESNEG